MFTAQYNIKWLCVVSCRSLQAWYCGVDCQKLAWSIGNHKKLCKKWSEKSDQEKKQMEEEEELRAGTRGAATNGHRATEHNHKDD